jgi:hypothetical protein
MTNSPPFSAGGIENVLAIEQEYASRFTTVRRFEVYNVFLSSTPPLPSYYLLYIM